MGKANALTEDEKQIIIRMRLQNPPALYREIAEALGRSVDCIKRNAPALERQHHKKSCPYKPAIHVDDVFGGLTAEARCALDILKARHVVHMHYDIIEVDGMRRTWPEIMEMAGMKR